MKTKQILNSFYGSAKQNIKNHKTKILVSTNLFAAILLLFSVYTINTTSHIQTKASGLPVGETLWSYGDNTYGQLGTGNTQNYTTPVQVLGMTKNVSQIQEGTNFSLVLKTDGTVWGFGSNGDGLLGTGTNDNNPHPTPVQIPGLTDIRQISTSGLGIFALALKGDGTVYSWGDDEWGDLGNGQDATGVFAPQLVLAPQGQSGYLNHIVAISTGYGYSLALRDDGTVWAWGYNDHGQLGNDTYDSYETYPTQVVLVNNTGALTGITSITASEFASYAIKSDGTAVGWGDEGSTSFLGSASRLDGICNVRDTWCTGGAVSMNGLSNLVKISNTNYGQTALDLLGNLTVWGVYYGTKLTSPTETALSSETADMESGGQGNDTETYVLKDDGTVWYFQNEYSYDPTYTNPLQVSGLSNITAISAGDYNLLALSSN